MSKSSLALSNLRAVVILIVLAFHSVLAYLDFLPPRPTRSTARRIEWQAFPIIDSQPLDGLRHLLRLARRLPDVVHVLPVRPVRVAEPDAQAERNLSVRPLQADRRAAHPGRGVPDAACLLPDLPGVGGRPERGGLLAASGGRCRSGRAARNGFCGSFWSSTSSLPASTGSRRSAASCWAGLPRRRGRIPSATSSAWWPCPRSPTFRWR